MSRNDQFIPHLVVDDGMAALKFYQEVFRASAGDVMMEPGGNRLMHGEGREVAAPVNRPRAAIRRA